MKRTALLLLTSFHLSFAYHLGFYVPLKNTHDPSSGWKYAHALTIAVDDVNNNPNILPGHNFTYSWTDSSDSEEVLRTMYQKYISPRTADSDAGRVRTPDMTTTALNGTQATPNVTQATPNVTQATPNVTQATPNTTQATPNTPVDVFIGPAFHCTAPAKLAQAFKIPMISYVSILFQNYLYTTQLLCSYD